MQGPGAHEIACAGGTLTILATRLLMRGRVSWALPIAEVRGVNCLRQGESCTVGLHVADGRRFIARGVTEENALRLIEMFGYVPAATPTSVRADLVPYGADADTDAANEADDIELHAAGLGGTLFITRRRILFAGPSPWVLPRRAVAAVVPNVRGAICDLAIITGTGQRGDIPGLACEDALRTLEALAVESGREGEVSAAQVRPAVAAAAVRPAVAARLAAPTQATVPLATTRDTLPFASTRATLPFAPSSSTAPRTAGTPVSARELPEQAPPSPAPDARVAPRDGHRPPVTGRDRPRHRTFWP
jgi:hypothetical protein